MTVPQSSWIRWQVQTVSTRPPGGPRLGCRDALMAGRGGGGRETIVLVYGTFSFIVVLSLFSLFFFFFF